MSMQSNTIDALYYSQNNLDNSYNQVADEILRRTNKDISKKLSFEIFNELRKIHLFPIYPLHFFKSQSTTVRWASATEV